ATARGGDPHARAADGPLLPVFAALHHQRLHCRIAARMSRSASGPKRGLPSHAWRWPMGAVPDQVSVPRVTMPMIDDGPWGGVPIGGLGAGSIGRTHRGDFARWHLDVGSHRFETVPANPSSVFVARGGERPGEPSARSAHV